MKVRKPAQTLSPLGLREQIRYRLFRSPAFIVDKRRTYIGWDPQELEALIDERIHQDIQPIAYLPADFNFLDL